MNAMSRTRAAFIHFALSGSVVLVVFALFWFVWYPNPMAQALGGLPIIATLFGIDVVLGPLLTFIVFDSRKKSLKFDLVAIAVVQVLALSYGVHTLFASRPAFVAAIGDKFDIVPANEISDSDIVAAKSSLPFLGPRWVGTVVPSAASEKERVEFSSLLGLGRGHFPQYHQPLANMRDEILKNASPVSSLAKFNPGKDADIQRWLADHGRTIDNTVFQGLKARAEDMAVIMDAKTAEVIGIAPFKPWD